MMRFLTWVNNNFTLLETYFPTYPMHLGQCGLANLSKRLIHMIVSGLPTMLNSSFMGLDALVRIQLH